MPETPTPGLRIRLLADKSEGERVVRYDPETGTKLLVNPETDQPEPWPLAGVQIEGDAPQACRVPTTWVERGETEGWIELEGRRLIHRPGGPPERLWKVTHTFVNADLLVLKTIDGDVRYRITHQPDKYAAEGDAETEVTPEVYNAGDTRVDHFFELELEG